MLSARAVVPSARVQRSVGRSQVSVRASANGQRAKAALPAFTTLALTGAQPAFAASIREAAENVQSAIDAASKVATEAGAVANQVAGVAKDTLEVVKPYAIKAVEEVTPIVGAAATETVRAATPIVEKGISSLATSLKTSGVDVDGTVREVSKISGKAVEVATPVAKSTLSAASAAAASDPVLFLSSAAAFAAFIVFSPAIFGLIASAARGYAGDLTPALVLDTLATSDATLVDIRSASQVESKGVPGLPRGSQNKLVNVEFDEIADRTLRSNMRNPIEVEAESTALIISQLKRVSKGKPVIIIDSNHSVAKLVAKKLSGLGFGQVYTVYGGFDGRGGWVSSGLSTSDAPTISGSQRSGSSGAGIKLLK